MCFRMLGAGMMAASKDGAHALFAAWTPKGLPVFVMRALLLYLVDPDVSASVAQAHVSCNGGLSDVQGACMQHVAAQLEGGGGINSCC